ncbi:deoxyguanosinetriphosphate triphosphohydrolase [Pseudomonadota bacterium]
MQTSAQITEKMDALLAPYALRNADSKGRLFKETHSDYRLPFQRDRDRVIHSRAFRRLQAKTQVFVAYYGDHYRDRMTHSIEVAQIARDISRRLGLNEDLSECIALAHDLGHTPFGHAGEQALDRMMQEYGGNFEHNHQSHRIVTKLERLYPDFDGLNLSVEVLDGLLKHDPNVITPHLEAQVTDLSDEIAYTNHDLDDGIRSGLLKLDQLRTLALLKRAEDKVIEKYGKKAFEHDEDAHQRFISRVISQTISLMIQDLQKTTQANLTENKIDSIEKVQRFDGKLVGFSAELTPEIREVRAFLLENFYHHEKVEEKIKRGQKVIEGLFNHYKAHPDEMSPLYKSLVESGEPLQIVIKDYIAGMTDHFAEEKFKEL